MHPAESHWLAVVLAHCCAAACAPPHALLPHCCRAENRRLVEEHEQLLTTIREEHQRAAQAKKEVEWLQTEVATLSAELLSVTQALGPDRAAVAEVTAEVEAECSREAAAQLRTEITEATLRPKKLSEEQIAAYFTTAKLQHKIDSLQRKIQASEREAGGNLPQKEVHPPAALSGCPACPSVPCSPCLLAACLACLGICLSACVLTAVTMSVRLLCRGLACLPACPSWHLVSAGGWRLAALQACQSWLCQRILLTGRPTQHGATASATAGCCRRSSWLRTPT